MGLSRDTRFYARKLLLFFLGLAVVASADAYANVLGNPGFEEEIGNGTAGNWDATNGAVRVNAADAAGLGFTAPPEGSFALRIPGNSFTFQTFDGVQEGDFVNFTILAESSIAPGGGNGGLLKIEFKRVFDNGSDALISDVRSSLITTANAPNGGGYQRFTISGTAPKGTGRVVFTLTQEGAGGNVIYDNASAEVNPVKLLVSANKTHARAGDVVTVFARFRNDFGTTLTNTELLAEIPRGLDFLAQSVRLNGLAVPFQEGSLIIPIGTIGANDTFTASFQVLVTRGVTIGKEYEIGVTVRNTGTLSERGRVRIIIRPDPLFDEGTIIGKVYNDRNQNAQQDVGEEGVPGVRLVTEEGVVVITDGKGRYHIPAVVPGRHLVKIDGHSLPEGTKFITEESYLVKITPGLLAKANFAVLLPPSDIPEQFREDLVVSITQGVDTSPPVLDVTMEPQLLRAGLGFLEKEATFHFQLNYPDFIRDWHLEIRDEMGNEVWTGFGVSAPPAYVTWSGQTEVGLLVKPGIYSYRLKVRDTEGHEDWSPMHFFRVVSKADTKSRTDLEAAFPTLGDFNLFKDGKKSIPLVAKPTIRIHGTTRPGNQVAVNGQPVTVDPATGSFQTEFYTTPGEKEIVVSATTPEGETLTYRKTLTVKDSLFFMVALGEEQLGHNWVRGRTETAGEEETLKEGFYEDGRLAYTLRGKIKGKFLIQSAYDTADKRTALFTNLDPDDYYPVYGDVSRRDYLMQDTRQRFYLLIEMDRSFVKWGSFKTAFTDTELSSYNRTLSGFKAHIETLSSSPYGDPKRELTVFWSKARHLADHNEFAATGGTLYYLRNRRVIEGSEKVRVEIRDKIQDIPIHSRDLVEGRDYEIDYDEGRILLARPLSSVSASGTLFSQDILDGNPVFLIVDYEFESNPNLFENENRGLRGVTQIGDHLRVGGTYVEEKRQNIDYDLRGVDATLKLGRNTQIRAEYAESQHEQVRHAVSYNGGLTFADISSLPARRTRESAYLIKAESQPLPGLGLSGYIQNVQPGFSNGHLRSQEGFEKHGLHVQYHWKDSFHAEYRYDASEVVSQLRPLHERGVTAPFEKFRQHTVQAGYQDDKWLAEAEYVYRTQDLTDPGTLEEGFDSILPFGHAITGKVGYRLNDRLLPYLKIQLIPQGKPNHQFGGGLRYEITHNIYAYLEQMIGNIGDSTYFGFERLHENGSRSYLNLRIRDRGIGTKTLSTSLGSSFSLTEKSRVYSEREHSTYDGRESFADVLGLEGTLGERWNYELRYERRHLDNDRFVDLDTAARSGTARSNTFNVWSGALAYAGEKYRARTAWEFRRDQDAPELWQWATRNYLDYRINQDLSFLGRLNFGHSRFLDPDGTPASFAEWNIGLAYRPVEHDRLNVLSRYTFVKDIANDAQFETPFFSGLATDEKSHILAIDVAYDVYKYLTWVEKIAYKKGIFSTAVTDPVVVNSLLWVNRLNFHVTRQWDFSIEYRALWQREAADNLRHGALVELDREFYDYVRLGVGYNFTDFDDDLRKSNDFDSHGPFVRLTGKF